MDIKSFGQLFEADYSLTQKYVSIVYDDETQENLLNWCEENGIDTTRDYNGDPVGLEFHTTIFYTTTFHHIQETEHILKRKGEAIPYDFEFLGREEDIPVMLVGGPDIYKIRDFFAIKYNMEDEWTEFKPHITISYSNFDSDLDELEFPDFPLTFDRVLIKDLEFPRDADIDSPDY